jgi:hypothetical protein
MTNAELRAATGQVQDHRPVIGFLYCLLRDHLPCGVVEALVLENEDLGPKNVCKFTNGYLAKYAMLLAERLGVPDIAAMSDEQRLHYWESLTVGYCRHCGRACDGTCYCTNDD